MSNLVGGYNEVYIGNALVNVKYVDGRHRESCVLFSGNKKLFKNRLNLLLFQSNIFYTGTLKLKS